MENSSLLIPLVIIGLLLRVLGTSASHFFENINYVATTDLALSLAFENEKLDEAAVAVLIRLVLGDRRAHQCTSPLRSRFLLPNQILNMINTIAEIGLSGNKSL